MYGSTSFHIPQYTCDPNVFVDKDRSPAMGPTQMNVDKHCRHEEMRSVRLGILVHQFPQHPSMYKCSFEAVRRSLSIGDPEDLLKECEWGRLALVSGLTQMYALLEHLRADIPQTTSPFLELNDPPVTPSSYQGTPDLIWKLAV
ncbi:hypothetical protein CLAIMM_05978 [Cladophialophora immunda]|nr:hypothetical protein CLAIMM_05978 [Cladophialophora immunda]